MATAIVGLRLLDGNVDRALDAAATAAVSRLDGELPTTTDGEGSATEERPGSSDTFVLVLDRNGRVVSNASRVPLHALPDAAAVAAAGRSGRDVRDIRSDNVAMRIETLPVTSDGAIVGYVQAGFVLTLHDQQSAGLVLTIILVGLVGLFGAALVARLVTGRALIPIRDTLRGQRRFVADASHELRTPATLIRAAGEILEREHLVAADGQRFTQDIQAEADRLGRLVDDLLTLASTDAGVLRVDRRPLDLADVAEETVGRAASLADERRVHLAFERSGPTRVDGDPDRLVQLLLILLDNASAHSPDGGTVTVSVEGRRRQVVLAVSDQGPGIPAAERERVFEPFHRLPSERRTGRGTGLGLAIAMRLAASHDARISVADAPGGGARFEVMFAAA